MNEYPTHKCLQCRNNLKIKAVMDCFSGKTLVVFPRRYAIGELVWTGPIITRGTDNVQVNEKSWVITGYSHWRTAKSMLQKCRSSSALAQLESGIWHEVISE